MLEAEGGGEGGEEVNSEPPVVRRGGGCSSEEPRRRGVRREVEVKGGVIFRHFILETMHWYKQGMFLVFTSLDTDTK